MDKNQILCMLFEEHHRQLVNKKQRIYHTVERVSGLYITLCGILLFVDKPILPGSKPFIIVFIILVAASAITSIYRNTLAYYTIASVIKKINESLELYKQKEYHPHESLYPASWKDFGEKGKRWALNTHVTTIIAGASICSVLIMFHA